MGERLLFTSFVRPFLSSRLEGADFSIFYVVAKKGYCSTRVHEQGGEGDKAGLASKEGGREGSRCRSIEASATRIFHQPSLSQSAD